MSSLGIHFFLTLIRLLQFLRQVMLRRNRAQFLLGNSAFEMAHQMDHQVGVMFQML